MSCDFARCLLIDGGHDVTSGIGSLPPSFRAGHYGPRDTPHTWSTGEADAPHRKTCPGGVKGAHLIRGSPWRTEVQLLWQVLVISHLAVLTRCQSREWPSMLTVPIWVWHIKYMPDKTRPGAFRKWSSFQPISGRVAFPGAPEMSGMNGSHDEPKLDLIHVPKLNLESRCVSDS